MPFLVSSAAFQPIATTRRARDLLADVLTESCNSVEIEPVLSPINGRAFTLATITTEENARVDKVAGGVWGGRFDRMLYHV